jgi:AcrR family transcriptional regulator
LIVDTAVKLFSEKPYEDISVDEVCAKAGVAHGLLSYYFGGKRGLFAAAVQKAWQELADAERARDDERTAVARVHGYVHRHFEYVSRHPQRFMTLMRTGHADREVLDIATNARSAALEEIRASLGCPSDPPARLRAAIWGWTGYMDNLTVEWLTHDDLDLDFVTDLRIQALVGSVRAANGRRYDVNAEFQALRQVAATPRQAELRAVPTDATA